MKQVQTEELEKTTESAMESCSRRARRSSETRMKIFTEALRLFSEKGITNVTVEEITDAADVGKGTFFNYFPTKEHLFTAMAELQLGKVKAAVEQSKTATTTRPVLLNLALNLATGHSRTPLLMRSMLSMVLSSKMLTELLSTALGQGRQHVAQIFTRGQGLGEIRNDIPAIELARGFQKLVFGTQVIWALDPQISIEDQIEHSFMVIWNGISAEKAKDSPTKKNQA